MPPLTNASYRIASGLVAMAIVVGCHNDVTGPANQKPGQPAGTPTHPVVSAGATHTCALIAGGRAYCWGLTDVGQLGVQATTTILPTPHPVSGDQRFATIASGVSSTCALLAADQRAYCWGSNDSGQLGIGGTGNDTITSPWVPHAVTGGLTFRSLQSNWAASCGIAADTTAYCWGGGLSVAGDTAWAHPSPTPVAIGRALTSAAIDALGGGCALTVANQGELWCWGSGLAPWPGLGVAPYDLGFSQLHGLVAGDGHFCALSAASAAICWGRDVYGTVGNDSATYIPRGPTLVSGGLAYSVLTAGGDHTCALATDATAYCWGLNGHGELGDGTVIERDAPVPVAGGLRFQSISAAHYHTCGVTSDDKVYCWGSNEYGQLGDGTTVDRHTPTLVVLPSGTAP